MRRLLVTLLAIVSLCSLSIDASARPLRGVAVSQPGPVDMGGGPNMLERSLFASTAPSLPFSQWYVPGNGSPALSTSDYYNMSGIMYPRPYDLDTMGAEGAAIKAREGKRYAWLIWDDHPGNWLGGTGLMVGYSDDPQVWPDPTTMRVIFDLQNSINITDKAGQSQVNLYAYWVPYMAYNPDPGAFAPFYIYAECQSTGGTARAHQLCLLTSTDLQSVTFQGPSIPTTYTVTPNGWTSFGMPERLGVNNWVAYSFGKADGAPTTLVYYKYTSTDGWDWTPDYSKQVAGPGPYVTIGAQKYLLVREDGVPNSYVSLLAVDSDNVSLGTYTRISTGFGENGPGSVTYYPGPRYLQGVFGYEEDGVMSIYVSRGFPVSGHDGTNFGPFLNNYPSFYDVTAQVTGCPGACVLDVQSVPTPGTVPPLAIGFRYFGSFNQSIASFGTGTGGVGTYNMTGNPGNRALGTFTMMTNGGSWQQWVDQYFLITNATTAASAAPLGVQGSCAAGLATVRWNNSLPHANYRVYYGSSSASQPTLAGNVTGTSITFTPPANQQTWVKVVTMNVTEQKSRVINVYCSAQTAQVNKHVNRVLNDGGTFNNLASDINFIATADAWLTTNDSYRYLNWWTDVRFGYKLDGSGFIAKIYDFGTTWLPRGGDYTPTTSNTFPSTSSNTSYSANSFRGTTPSWINNAGTARGYFGNGRANNIQRWSEATFLAAYQKPGTAAATFFGLGEFRGIYLQHGSGSTGNINFAMGCDKISAPTTFTTATAPFTTATAPHVAAGVFDGTNLIAYLDGVGGTPQSCPGAANNNDMLKDTYLRGQFSIDAQSVGSGPFLGSGTRDTRFSYVTRSYTFGNSEAQYTGAGLAAFSKGFPASQVQSWGALYNFLLKRDIDPASNDNDPMWLEKAA